MFYDNELNFLQNMLTKCHIRSTVIDPNLPINQQLGEGSEKFINLTEPKGSFFEYFPEVKPKIVYRIIDIFLCRYIFFELPFCEKERVFIIGPYLNTEISHQEIFEQGEKMGISPKHSKELKLYYSSLPVIKEESTVFAMVYAFAEFLWGGSDSFSCTDVTRENLDAFSSVISETLSQPYGVTPDVYAMEERYSFENALMAAISQGNTQKAELMLSGISILAFDNRVSDPIRNLKNYCIIMNTLFRKAAETGGVHPIYLDKVSSDFAVKIESLHTMTTAFDFMAEILRAYCNLVRKHKTNGYSALVQKVIIKVENDLTDELSLKAIAESFNVSPGYLSAIFKNETDETLTEYINKKRISHAKYLLKNTNLQIQTVAQHCGILDLHYFSRMFKKHTGKTPTQYREDMR